MKNKPKNRDSLYQEKITARILKYWFIDSETNEVKPLKKYKKVNKLVSYNTKSKTVTVYRDKPIQIYTSLKDATIDLYMLQIEKKRSEWQQHVDKSMELNKEISDLLDKLDHIRNTYY